MRKNIGELDKLIRVLLAFFLGIICFFNLAKGVLATALLSIAVLLCLTALVNFCPLYHFMGQSSIQSSQ